MIVGNKMKPYLRETALLDRCTVGSKQNEVAVQYWCLSASQMYIPEQLKWLQ